MRPQIFTHLWDQEVSMRCILRVIIHIVFQIQTLRNLTYLHIGNYSWIFPLFKKKKRSHATTNLTDSILNQIQSSTTPTITNSVTKTTSLLALCTGSFRNLLLHLLLTLFIFIFGTRASPKTILLNLYHQRQLSLIYNQMAFSEGDACHPFIPKPTTIGLQNTQLISQHQ